MLEREELVVNHNREPPDLSRCRLTGSAPSVARREAYAVAEYRTLNRVTAVPCARPAAAYGRERRAWRVPPVVRIDVRLAQGGEGSWSGGDDMLQTAL